MPFSYIYNLLSGDLLKFLHKTNGDLRSFCHIMNGDLKEKLYFPDMVIQ